MVTNSEQSFLLGVAVLMFSLISNQSIFMKQILLLISTLLATTSLVGQSPPSDLSYVELDSLYDLEYKNGHYQEALSYIKLATDAARKLENSDSLYATSLTNLGDLHREFGNNTEAEECFNEALSIQQKTLGETHSDCAKTLTALVLIYIDEGKFDIAESYSLDAIYIHKKNKGKESVGYAVALNNLALLYYNIGKNEAAEVAYLEVLSIFKILVGDKHQAYAQVSSNLALVYSAMQKYSEGESLLHQALSIYEKVFNKEHPKYLEAASELALVYDYTKQYAKSEALYLKTLILREKVLGKNNINYIFSLSNLAGVYIELSKYKKAESLYLEVISFYKKRNKKNSRAYINGLGNLAIVYKLQNRYTEAEELYHEAFIIGQNLFKYNQSALSVNLNNLAYFYQITGEYDKAKKYLKKALDINIIGNDTIDLNKLSNLLKYKFSNNRYAFQSLQYLPKIYDKMYKDLGHQLHLKYKQNALDVAILFNKKVRAELGSNDDKLRSLLKTSDLVESILENTMALKEEKNTVTYLENAFSHAEQNKSILLTDALKGQRAVSMGDLPDSLKTKEHLLEEAISELKKEKATSKTKENDLLLQKKEMELTIDINNFKQLLKNKYPKYNALKYENITASSKDIQQLLKKGEALIEYFVAEDDLYVFYVDKKTIKLYNLSISKKILHKKVSQLRNGLTNYASIRDSPQKSFEAYTKPAYWFYSKVVAPALVEAKDIKHLIVVTDGELGNLPFEAFLTEQASEKKSDYNNLKYLLHDFAISYNYSATLLKASSELSQRKHNGKLLAIAPTYDGDSTPSEVRRPMHLENLRKNLNPLPAAIEEVKGLEDLLVGNFWYGTDGNEAHFKEKAGDYAIIHLAMHGLLNSYSPILSSLAFTENGDSIEDNFLYAHEISKLKLNADLVVLSACETGYGKFEQGEGILSLARSFMYAGTPSLVVSLWPVNDGSTAVIMKLFYENLADGMTKSIALQQAKLVYLENRNGPISHPAFWSPFIQLGDSKPIGLKSKEDFPFSLTYVGIGLLLLGGVFFFIRRKTTKLL
jgi:CHAT domain-containing protein/tetratricopeptide (TPR) repeat protein